MGHAEKAFGGNGPLQFELGAVVMTRGVADLVEKYDYAPFIHVARHARCDWGQLTEEDLEANTWALQQGGRLLSSYPLPPGMPEGKVWVITEADRSVTTVLLPSEY